MGIFSKFKTSIATLVTIACGVFTAEAAQGQSLLLPVAAPRSNAVSRATYTALPAPPAGKADTAAQRAEHKKIDPILKSKISTKISERLSIPKELVTACLSKLEKNKKCGFDEIAACSRIIWAALNDIDSNSSEKLNLLCWHLLLDLATPSQINQGNHNTCALAALESYLAVKHPSVVCKVVLDALNNKYTLADGRKIQIDERNLSPDRESLHYQAGGTYRSYASQLFQIAAANAYWQEQKLDPRMTKVPLGSIRYIQDYSYPGSNSRDTGERLLIFWPENTIEQVTGEDGLFPASSPCLNLEAIDQTYKLITQMSDAPALLAHKSKGCGKPVLKFSDEASLKKILKELKAKDSFPAIISLNMNSTVLNPAKGLLVVSDNKLVYANTLSRFRGWHVLCVDDYDEIADATAIDNFWGSSSDFLERKLSSHELWSGSFAQGKPQM